MAAATFPAPPPVRGPHYCANSCFLDSLVMALLHRPPAALRARLEAEAVAESRPVASELIRLLRHIHAPAAQAGGPPHGGTTCTALRQLLHQDMQRRGYENPADGQPRDASEMLKALLQILRFPDTLQVQRTSEIFMEDRWIQRAPPATAPHGTVWTVHLPCTARSVGQALHLREEQEVEGRLDAEDAEELRQLHGAAAPRTNQYTKRRDIMKLVGVDGDLFFVELARAHIDRSTGRVRMSDIIFAPDSIRLSQARVFDVISLLCHRKNHYTCVLRHGRAWWEYDDRMNQLRACALTPDKLRTAVLYMYALRPAGAGEEEAA